MNRETFFEALNVMCDALPTPNQDRRVSALYEFFGQKDFARVSDAAKMAAKEAERFPTPAAFEEFYRRTGRKTGKVERELCDRCDGFGFVSLPEGTYRGRCPHGARLSAEFSDAPDSYRSTRNLKSMTDEELANDLVALDPRQIYRGILALGAGESKLPFMKRMHAMCLEMLGEKIAKEIRGEVAKAALDLTILERKTPERMGRPGAKQNEQQTPKSHSETRSQEVNHE